ncbi:MAG: DUF512 domain-containing protein [Desulfuromonas sp.]|nr:MAG: DUF512 domain-containing protein [Desulfuromonas sp.]
MVEIIEIIPGGIADQLALAPGDSIVAIDDDPARDFLDVLIAELREEVTLVVEKSGNGELWALEIEKEAGEPFGFVLKHPEPARCGNNCIFCFVHQMPKGMRRTLYVKDEDYRFSYLYGAYVTLSNVSKEDIERIINQRLSPLYVSIHATDPDVRSRMLGRAVSPIQPIVEQLVAAGIELHTQVVVCPGVNDNAVLSETVATLAAYYPGIKSLALVPVGLTEHRQNLENLQPVTKDDARKILAELGGWQQRFLGEHDSRIVFAADEFYLKAEGAIPELTEYEDLDQLENGVGMIAQFRALSEETLSEVGELNCPVQFSIVTGVAFHPELQRFVMELEDAVGCSCDVYAVENRLFGPMVTVAGLVSGQDIVRQLQNRNPGSALLVPDVMMRDGDHRFLDDLTPEQLGEQLGCRVMVVPSTPWGIIDAIEELNQ